jgi:hypothetical protein
MVQKTNFKLFWSLRTLPLKNRWVGGRQRCDSRLITGVTLRKYNRKPHIRKEGRGCSLYLMLTVQTRTIMAYGARAASVVVTLGLPKWNVQLCTRKCAHGRLLILAIKESQHVPFQGRHDCRLTTVWTVQMKHKEIHRWAGKGDSLSFLTLCVFEWQEGRGDANSADGRLY